MRNVGWAALAWACLLASAATSEEAACPADCYLPIEGGFRIRLTADPSAPRLDPGSRIGIAAGASAYGEGHAFASGPAENPRLHRRPLYPPADKALIWNEAERAKMPQCGFRPLVLAYNEPRFLFDLHAAGGLMGHLHAGLIAAGCADKWFHQWAEVDVSYVDGRMEYRLRDPEFPGVDVTLEAIALADSVGVLLRVAVDGPQDGARLVWAYGGASAFFTNYAMTAPEFTFASAQCAKDNLRWDTGRFALRRAFDASDSLMEQVFAAPRFLPEWQAVIHGGSSWESQNGFGDPETFADSPAALLATGVWAQDASERTGRVAVQEISVKDGNLEGFIVVGLGGDIEQAIADPGRAYRAARERNEAIASRVVAHTPDPYLDAAVRMMAFATDGLWGDSTVMHGGWSWRFGYLGWRGWYGVNCYGWTDRIQRAIRNNVAYGLIRDGDDAGALSSLLDTPGGVFYNMNEVFLDQVRQYFDYTGDLDLMREVFPVLQSIVAWENRRLRPENEALYENALNTWISDSHWYVGGQCAQASAYMLAAHTFLAGLAARLGENPQPYLDGAERIRTAMQAKLWMPERGAFAEYLDTRGLRLLHREPELPTLYHAAEFGAADGPLQLYQLASWGDLFLRTETTPGGGKLYWSSNWYPNNGRSYTHSTCELAYGEELDYALTNYLAGRSANAYAIIRATLAGIFNGPTPGGLSCHCTTDGRQRANDEFADAVSMWGRTVVEGLFGIEPRLQDDLIELSPQFPPEWNEASIRTPLFEYRWRRGDDTIAIDWNAPKPTALRLRIPLRAETVRAVHVGHVDICRVEPGVGVAWFVAEVPRDTHGRVEIDFEPNDLPETLGTRTFRQGEALPANVDPSSAALLDEQGRLKTTGPALVFLRSPANLHPGECPLFIPLRLEVEPAEPVPVRLWTPPEAGDRDLERWSLVDLVPLFNTTILDALDRVSREATPPPPDASRVGFDYWRSHLGSRHHGDPVQVPSDAAWRAKVGEDNIAWTDDGIPFKTAKEGPNIAVVTRAGAYPVSVEIPVGATGTMLYLMLSGMSFPTQSHVPQLRVTLAYGDGTSEQRDLVSPADIGDCWSTWCNRWHDTPANGFENLGGRFGPAGSAEAGDLTQPIRVDTEAHILAFPLRPGVTLQSVSIEAIANDVLFGAMGASVLR